MSQTLVENSTKTTIESWFIPFDILMIIDNVLSIILSILFLILILIEKTCRTVPMMLVANSCIATFMFATAMLITTSFTLRNDLKQIQYTDSFCIYIGYVMYATCSMQNYSFLLLAIYRYVLIVYPTRRLWHSYRIQILFISISWIIAFIYPSVFIFIGQILYDVDNQSCQIPPGLSFSNISMSFCLFIIPVSMIMLIYLRLVRYVKQMGTYVTTMNTLLRAQRELKMVRRTVILVTILGTICIPYQMFLLMSFFNRTPKYNFRIAYIFGDTSILCVIVTLFRFTDPLKASLSKRIKKQTTAITPAIS